MLSIISFKWLRFLNGIAGILFISMILLILSTDFSLNRLSAGQSSPDHENRGDDIKTLPDSPDKDQKNHVSITAIQSESSEKTVHIASQIMIADKSPTTVQNMDKPDISSIPSRTAGRKVPVRLLIPAIKVNSFIEQVGLTPKGAVDVPRGPKNTAWFKLGPQPGDIGSAVIVGHYGRWINGVNAVFTDIIKLRTGDKLSIKDSSGATISFIVRDVKKYKADEEVPEVFYSSDGRSHLNLITCVGSWNKKTKSYSNRLVVYTDKE